MNGPRLVAAPHLVALSDRPPMRHGSLRCADARLVADPAAALIWPEQELVVVADLHLEKGSSFARRGSLLPPYDTPSTLGRLEAVLGRWRPRRVISLGDGFHDALGSGRLGPADRRSLRALVGAHDWLWVAGNHDPGAPEGLGGRFEEAVEISGLRFRHVPEDGPTGGEVAGHLHPSASVVVRGQRLVRRCFVADARRILLPAFGSYTGGLDVFDPAIASLFGDGFEASLLGDGRIHAFSNHRLRDATRRSSARPPRPFAGAPPARR